jgi:FkbM family methyltransferase
MATSSKEIVWIFKSKIKKIVSALIGILPSRLKKELFYFIAKSANVLEYSIPWKYGIVSGSVGDSVVFRELFRSGSFSDDIVSIFTEHNAKSKIGTFLDVGGNIGLIAIPIAAETGATVHTFEPEPTNFRLLSGNVKSAGLSHIVNLHNLALFDKKMELEFELSSGNHGDHRIKGSLKGDAPISVADEKDKKILRVAGDRLDSVIVLKSLAAPIVCKIDTQGAEPQVYAGGREIFRTAELLVIEFWPYGMKRIGGDIGALITMLMEDFSKGGIRRDDKDYHDPTFDGPSSRLEPVLRRLEASAGMDDWCDLVLSR